MAADTVTFAGSVPANYDKFMVPMIFEPYAREVAERLYLLQPKDVLEIAAGTGVLTRAMTAALGPDTRFTVTDLSQPMLDIAMDRQGADSRISWKQADGLALPFADGVFDAVACQFGVMFYPDKIKGYSEARRVLKADGCFIFDVWDRVENNEFIDVVGKALAELFPADPPRFMERIPHGYWKLDTIGEESKAAGFSAVQFDSIEHVSRAASAHDAVFGYCLGSPLGNEIETRAPGQMPAIVDRLAAVLQARFGKGSIEGKIRAHIVTAVR